MKKRTKFLLAVVVVAMLVAISSVALADIGKGKILIDGTILYDDSEKKSWNITLDMGESVTVIEKLDEVYRIKAANGKYGYVVLSAVGLEGSTSVSNTAETIKINNDSYQVGIVNAKDVNFRKEPSSKGKIISKLKKDTKVGIVQVLTEYYQVITTAGTKGYVARQYIKVNGPIVLKPDQKEVKRVNAETYWTKPSDAPSYSISSEDQAQWDSVARLASNAKAKNGDIQGYIQVPDTNIFHPVVIGKDNNYYLYRDAYKQSDKKGSIYFDFRNGDQYQRRHLILYGHNMSTSKTMFHWLINYKDPAWVRSHPVIKMTAFGGSVWQYVSSYVALPESKYIVTKFNDDSEWTAYMKRMQDQSANRGKVPDVQLRANDQILTLVTCSYDIKPKGRLYVHFRRVE